VTKIDSTDNERSSNVVAEESKVYTTDHEMSDNAEGSATAKAETSAETIFHQFYDKLVEKLPMDDPNFTAKLYAVRLLSDHLKE